jgi:hypothetical protein
LHGWYFVLDGLPGVCQNHYRRRILQTVQCDSSGRAAVWQNEVTDVQLSRRNGTGGHHQVLIPGPWHG